MNLRDDPHTCTTNSDVCAHCGQPLPGRTVLQYGERRTSRTGLAVTILLHLLLVALYFYQPERPKEKPAPAREGQTVYVAPLAKPKPAAPAPTPKTVPSSKPRPSAPAERARVERLPDTITIPDEEPAPVAKAEPKPEPAPQPRLDAEPGMDMAEYIARRRAARGAPTEAPAEETEAQRGTRNALANIAAINGRSRDEGKGKAMLTIRDQTFHSAVIDFSGYNPNFKRKWLSTINVEQGKAPDVETAVIDRLVDALRRGMNVDFVYESRSGRQVPLSTRPEDEEHLRAFLFKELFPEYRRAPPR